MGPLDLAQKYMEIFFSGRDIADLSHLFSTDFTFSGPFYEFDSAADYLNSLKSDPPKNLHYKVIRAFENESLACLVYQFSKPGINIPMAQMFEVSNGKISKILLIFDTGAFA
ncbi:MAG: nuclear transport factor 2 family protein [Pseudanabaenales cyanobacterium]|nr:nuclear transport factor 2 family protein [Pseudanabaenales cyanobacterium]